MEFSKSGYRTTVTLNGTDVILYNNEAGGLYPIHGAYLADDEWILAAWTAQGRKFKDVQHELDLASK